MSNSTVVNMRYTNMFGGQLYVSTSSGSSFRLGAVGSGTPTAGGQSITRLPGLSTSGGSPSAFFIADLDAGVAGVDTLYLADDTPGTIQKYCLVGGTWASRGTISAGAVRGLTGASVGTTVNLFATTGGSGATGGGTLYSFSDTTGYNGTVSGSATSIATAAANTAFRGIAFVPEGVAPPTYTPTNTPSASATPTLGTPIPCSYVVTTTNDSGEGSFRQAILCANNDPGTQTIIFNIPGSGPHTIIPLSQMPPSTDPIVIDGFSQPESSPNTNPIGDPINARLMVVIDGTFLNQNGIDTFGLRFEGGNSLVQGLVISGFIDDGIQIGGGPGGDGDIVRGNFLGTDVTGTQALGNDDGIDSDTAGNTIGGMNPADRNLISGNNDDGVDLDDSEGITGTNNIILGNYIGTNISGTAALGNVEDGVVIDPPDNQIGAPGLGGRNIIAGNHDDGIQLKTFANNTLVINNYIGTNAAGTGPFLTSIMLSLFPPVTTQLALRARAT